MAHGEVKSGIHRGLRDLAGPPARFAQSAIGGAEAGAAETEGPSQSRGAVQGALRSSQAAAPGPFRLISHPFMTKPARIYAFWTHVLAVGYACGSLDTTVG